MKGPDFITRHSIKPKEEDVESSKYKGISERGVELAKKQRARELLDKLIAAEEGTIMFLGGASDLVRTKSTEVAYGDGMKDIVSEEKIDDVLVLTPDDFAMAQKEAQDNKDKSFKLINWVKEKVAENSDKKIVIDYPMFINEFSINDDRYQGKDKSGKPISNKYTKKLMAVVNNDENASIGKWLENGGKMDGLQGPDPVEVAKRTLSGIQRLREFAEANTPGRPLMIGAVGHAPALTVTALYLLDPEHVDLEGYKKLKSKHIGETEVVKINEVERRPVLQYGDLTIPLEN